MKKSTLKFALILNIIAVIIYTIACSLFINEIGFYVFAVTLGIGQIYVIFSVIKDKSEM